MLKSIMAWPRPVKILVVLLIVVPLCWLSYWLTQATGTSSGVTTPAAIVPVAKSATPAATTPRSTTLTPAPPVAAPKAASVMSPWLPFGVAPLIRSQGVYVRVISETLGCDNPIAQRLTAFPKDFLGITVPGGGAFVNGVWYLPLYKEATPFGKLQGSLGWLPQAALGPVFAWQHLPSPPPAPAVVPPPPPPAQSLIPESWMVYGGAGLFVLWLGFLVWHDRRHKVSLGWTALRLWLILTTVAGAFLSGGTIFEGAKWWGILAFAGVSVYSFIEALLKWNEVSKARHNRLVGAVHEMGDALRKVPEQVETELAEEARVRQQAADARRSAQTDAEVDSRRTPRDHRQGRGMIIDIAEERKRREKLGEF